MKRNSLLLFLTIICTVTFAWKPIFIGHRGGYTGVQNTVESYTNGVTKYHYQGLECDVRVTKDNQYVISHDEATTSLGGSLTVASSTLAQLKAETLKQTRGGITYTGKICTVAEYLAICKQYDVIPMIELKWTTGINTNSMVNFPGLYNLVKSYGLENKAIFLTSMKASLEYIRTNYPTAQCQFLTAQYWANHFDWCVKWGINPSIEAGCFDAETVMKFHKAGLQVAVWTVNTAANYEKYGNWGVYMMTCDYLYPNQQKELADIDWGDEPVIDPLQVYTQTIFEQSKAAGNFPQNFPSRYASDGSSYKSAYQGTFVDGVLMANDFSTGQMATFATNQKKATFPFSNVIKGSTSYGMASDDAGNLILCNDDNSTSPHQLVIWHYNNPAQSDTIEFKLTHPGKTPFISASGSLFSAEGGYVYFFPNGQNYVDILHFQEGKLVEVLSSQELALTGTSSNVIPYSNNPDKFFYQSRSKGIYLYDGEDKGVFLESGSIAAPNYNLSGGGLIFQLAGHDLLLYPSGTNYNGGFTVKDLSATKKDVLFSVEPLGTTGIKGNNLFQQSFKAEQVSDKTVLIYNYSMGNGMAVYRVSTDALGEVVRGDINYDGVVNVGDLTVLINMIMEGYATQDAVFEIADMNEDDVLNVGDITLLVSKIME